MTRLIPLARPRVGHRRRRRRRAAQAQDWYTFNGDLAAQKYATATQITPDQCRQADQGLGGPHRRRFGRQAATSRPPTGRRRRSSSTTPSICRRRSTGSSRWRRTPAR